MLGSIASGPAIAARCTVLVGAEGRASPVVSGAPSVPLPAPLPVMNTVNAGGSVPGQSCRRSLATWSEALREERRIKGLSRRGKELLLGSGEGAP